MAAFALRYFIHPVAASLGILCSMAIDLRQWGEAYNLHPYNCALRCNLHSRHPSASSSLTAQICHGVHVDHGWLAIIMASCRTKSHQLRRDAGTASCVFRLPYRIASHNPRGSPCSNLIATFAILFTQEHCTHVSFDTLTLVTHLAICAVVVNHRPQLPFFDNSRECRPSSRACPHSCVALQLPLSRALRAAAGHSDLPLPVPPCYPPPCSLSPSELIPIAPPLQQ